MSLWHYRYMGQTLLIELLVITENVLLFLPSNQFWLLWHPLPLICGQLSDRAFAHLPHDYLFIESFTSLWPDPKPTETVVMQKFFLWFLPWTRHWRFGIHRHRSPVLEKIFRVHSWSWSFGQKTFHVQKSMQTE